MKRYITSNRVRHLRDIGCTRKSMQWFDSSSVRKINQQSSISERYNMSYVGNEYNYRFKLKDCYQRCLNKRRLIINKFNDPRYYYYNKHKISGYK